MGFLALIRPPVRIKPGEISSIGVQRALSLQLCIGGSGLLGSVQ